MIKSFADKTTEELFTSGRANRIPAELAKRVVRKLDMIDSAYRVQDLRVPPGNRPHLLSGDRFGQWSIAINDQWSLRFRFEGEDAYDVELCDCH
ncbi:MAG: type II toxin-antitoxin system RelE/ParE family toxin [Eggerthellaceae bacterium]|nr:type II toxin-antitoxin system RelE/ParE family toxin [Eggerthellaceae bacterium]